VLFNTIYSSDRYRWYYYKLSKTSGAKSQYYCSYLGIASTSDGPTTCTQGPGGVIFRIYPCSSRARQADQTNGLFEIA
jgi:hypothetical protein